MSSRNLALSLQDPVVSITASGDGAYVATASHDGSVSVWSVQHGDVVSHHEGPDRMLQVTPVVVTLRSELRKCP